MPSPWRAVAWVPLALVVAAPVAGQQPTEHDIVEFALRDGPRARAIRAGVAVVRAEQHARRAMPNPSVSYSREGAGFAEFLQVEQPIPFWRTRAALARAGVAAIDAAEAERDAQLAALRAEVRSLLADLSSAQAVDRATRDAIAGMEKIVVLLRTREREGEGSRFDRLRAEREVADIRRALAASALRAADARGRLQALLPDGTRLDAVTGTTLRDAATPGIATLLDTARTSRPELRVLRRTAQRFTNEADAARRARLPQPVISAGLKRGDTEDGRERGSIFGLSLSVPLFDRGSRDAARWEAERTRADAEASALTRQIEAEVGRGAEMLELHRQALADYERTALEQTNALRTIADTAYVEGALGILELLDAYRSDWTAHAHAATLRFDVRRAQIELERSVGGMIWP